MTTTVNGDDVFLQLHELRLRGRLEAAADSGVAALVDAGFAVQNGTWLLLTPAGRSAHADWARLPAGSAEEEATRVAYERFLVFDGQVKQVTTDWQLAAAEAKPEGYSITEWDLIDRLTAIHEGFGPRLLALGKAVPRFAGYRPRLRDALTRLENGERQWFSGVTVDSYHTVWWQLHEDLLAALGINRMDDPNQ